MSTTIRPSTIFSDFITTNTLSHQPSSPSSLPSETIDLLQTHFHSPKPNLQQPPSSILIEPIDQEAQPNLIDAHQRLCDSIKSSNLSGWPVPHEPLDWLCLTLSSTIPSSKLGIGDDPILHLMLSTLHSDQPDHSISATLLDTLGLHQISLIEPILRTRYLTRKTATRFSSPSVGSNFNRPRPPLEAYDPKRLGPEFGQSDLDKLATLKAQALIDASNQPLFSHGGFIEEAPVNPHIFSSSSQTTLNWSGGKFALPIGTTRSSHELFEEIFIPPTEKIPLRSTEELIQITDLDPIARQSFPGYATLNRLQSAVFPIAYKTNQNMLVCAPTGAGKTDVAMLTVLRAITQYGGLLWPSSNHTPKQPIGQIRRDFKVVYVAPMKALAAEIVRKMGKRLGWLGFVVKELTGDMQLTKAEINNTHLIVTTPEKWDVVTRKASGEEDLVSKVRLLIIDEVHLLHEDRGAVIETIVARTLRQVESSQSLIRIVGLSATLPNYTDVSDFLRVNPMQGLFFFDSSFRPVPLAQHFIGVKGKPNSVTSRTNLDLATFEKISQLVKEGHQVMVFVHARKETVKTATMLRERAMEESIIDLFDPSEHPKYDSFKRELAASRNKEMKDLVRSGFGIHHAGMLRSDRNISERLFETGVTKVLCCTATLAWGVNLPAYAVIIKGTQIYDSSKGSFVDLGILDVLQIFGRAGRPQYEDHGVGYICTTHDRLDHYVAAITQQHPIESQFVGGIVDSLNAEVALGTVTTVDEGVQWIGWTYLFVRMRKNPMVYGLTLEDLQNDPWLGSKRHTLIVTAAKKLRSIGMVLFDEDLGTLVPTEVGRIASRYYIKHASIEVFNQSLRPKMSEADALAMISESVEFHQIKIRESECDELDQLQATVPCQVKGGSTSTPGKVNILLQAHISRCYVEDFALVSDMAYVAQNAARIARALVEISIFRRSAESSRVLIEIGKCIDKRMWPFAHPLIQAGLSDKLVYELDQRAGDVEIEDLTHMTAAEIGEICHQNERLGGLILKAARQFPRLSVGYTLQPLSSDLLRIRIDVTHEFDWSKQFHGQGEPFWVWIEDDLQRDIMRITRVFLRATNPEFALTMVVPFGLSTDRSPDRLGIRVVSDRWVGADSLTEVNLKGIILPSTPPPFSQLLDLPLLSTPKLGLSYCSRALPSYLDPAETQCFHAVNHTPSDLLICTPNLETGRRLALVATDRALRLATHDDDRVIVLISPTKVMAKQLHEHFKTAFGPVHLIIDSRSAAGNSYPCNRQHRKLVITTPEAGQLALGSLELENIILTIFMDLHLLNASYERLISVFPRCNSTRFLAFSSSMSDVRSIADWLGIPRRQVYNFAPLTRYQPMTITFESVNSTCSMAQLRSLVKPVTTILRTSQGTSVLIFVPSQRVSRSVGRALVQSLATDIEPDNLGCTESMASFYADQFSDKEVADMLTHGIMVLHNKMERKGLQMAIELFTGGKVKRMVVPRDMCWRMSSETVKAERVIVLGTQYQQLAKCNEEGVNGEQPDGVSQVVEEVSLGELVQMQSFVGHSQPHPSATMVVSDDRRFVVMCATEQLERYRTFLEGGMSIESNLLRNKGLARTQELDHLLAWLVSGEEWAVEAPPDKSNRRGRSDVVRFLSRTYLGHRVRHNPWYYGIQISSEDAGLNEKGQAALAISRLADKWVKELVFRSCLKVIGDQELEVTKMGEEMVKGQVSLGKLDEWKEAWMGMMNSERITKEFVLEWKREKRGCDQAAVRVFYGRLPKYVKEQIGAEPEQAIEDQDVWGVKVLLVALSVGRIPIQDSGLELCQASLLMFILKATQNAPS